MYKVGGGGVRKGGGGEKGREQIPPVDSVASGSHPCLIEKERILPLLFLKIDFKYNLLLITVKPPGRTE